MSLFLGFSFLIALHFSSSLLRFILPESMPKQLIQFSLQVNVIKFSLQVNVIQFSLQVNEAYCRQNSTFTVAYTNLV